MILAFNTTSALANSNNVAVGMNIGLQGLSLEGRTPITDGLFGRMAINYFGLSRNFEDGTLKYKGDLRLLSTPLMLDYHPFDQSGFRLSAGIAYNGNRLKTTAKPIDNVRINGNLYSPKEIGTVKSELKLGNAIAPILSLGYDSSFISESAASFNFELGAMYSGTPKFKISASGLAGTQTQFIKDLNDDANKALKDIKKIFKFYPVLSVGFKYRF